MLTRQSDTKKGGAGINTQGRLRKGATHEGNQEPRGGKRIKDTAEILTTP